MTFQGYLNLKVIFKMGTPTFDQGFETSGKLDLQNHFLSILRHLTMVK